MIDLTGVPDTPVCPTDCWAFRHFDWCKHQQPVRIDPDIELAAIIDRSFDRD